MVVDLLRSQVALEVEIWMLRQQRNVLRRAALAGKPHVKQQASGSFRPIRREKFPHRTE
jgi:hypothetical protein